MRESDTSLWEALKRRTHEVIEKAAIDDQLSHAVDITLALLILSNVIVLMFETIAPIRAKYGPAFDFFDVMSLAIFTAEYALRVWSCTVEAEFSRPIIGRLRYATQPMMILDLLVILPFYLPTKLPYTDLRYGRALRLIRLFRIIRIARYSSSLQTLQNVFVRKKEELIIAFFVEIILLIVAGSMVYFAEVDAQPEKFSSIPAALWWSMSTLTTVGYGDIVPITSLGRSLAMGCSLIGIAMFALPVGILGAGFVEERDESETRMRTGQVDNPYENGYVFLNFPGVARFHALAQEIRHVERDVPICIVDDRIEELPQSVANSPHVHFVRGSVLDRFTYTRARLRENKTIIVFPTNPSVPDSDGTTRTVVNLVSGFVENKARVLHMLVSAENAWMFEDMDSTSVMENLSALALVQESQDPHSARIVQILLLNTEGGNPHTVIPCRIVGWSWFDFAVACANASKKSGVMANPLAIVKRGVPQVCPNADVRIEEGDALSIVTIPGFDWDAFENAMVEFRIAEGNV